MKHEPSYRLQSQNSVEDLTLLKDNFNDDGYHEDLVDSDWVLKLRFMKLLIASLLIIVLALIAALLGLFLNRGSHTTMINLNSPVQPVVEYKTTVFQSSAMHAPKTIYHQSPSPEVDAAWQDLYSFGTSWITKDEASRLQNRTYRLQGGEDRYVIELDVFHQLHCLNILRRAIHWDYYKTRVEGDPLHFGKLWHWEHCIESIRQSLICSADVSPLVWTWHESDKKVMATTHTAHTCRDFDKIKEWAWDRRITDDLKFEGVDSEHQTMDPHAHT